VWGGAPILMMSYVSQAVHPFYLLLTLPALHLAAGAGLAQLAELIGKRAVGQIALMLVLAAFGALSALNALRYAEESLATPSVDGLSALPLGEGVRMARQLLSAEQIGASVVFADVDGWTLNSLAGRLFEVDRDADAMRTLYSPARGGVYLQFRPAGQEQAFPLPIAPFARYAFADGGTVAAWRVPREMFGQTRSVPSDRGLTLIDVQLDGALRPGQTARLFISFRVDALPEARVHWLFAPFAHVYDASGVRVLIADGAVTPGWAWRLGDIQRKTLHLHLPASAQAPFRIEIGLYDGVHSEAARFQVGEAWLPSLTVELP